MGFNKAIYEEESKLLERADKLTKLTADRTFMRRIAVNPAVWEKIQGYIFELKGYIRNTREILLQVEREGRSRINFSEFCDIADNEAEANELYDMIFYLIEEVLGVNT